MELLACLRSGKSPVDDHLIAIDRPIPSAGLAPQQEQARNSALAQALPGEQADFDFGLVQPTAVLGCVMDVKAIPQITALLFAEVVSEGLATVDVKVIHNQVDGFSQRILADDLTEHWRQLGCRAIWRRKGEVPAGLGFDGTENVSGATALVLIVTPGYPARTHRQRRPHIGVQQNWLFVKANYRFGSP